MCQSRTPNTSVAGLSLVGWNHARASCQVCLRIIYDVDRVLLPSERCHADGTLSRMRTVCMLHIAVHVILDISRRL